VRGRDICHQGIARSPAYALADPIEDARGQHNADVRGERKERLAAGTEGIAYDRKYFAFSQVVAPPRPSTNPTVKALAPKTETMKTGSRLWTISEEISISMLTKPSTQILAGI
jgi:hypothetical protein